jgi:hypothetical protein
MKAQSRLHHALVNGIPAKGVHTHVNKGKIYPYLSERQRLRQQVQACRAWAHTLDAPITPITESQLKQASNDQSA